MKRLLVVWLIAIPLIFIAVQYPVMAQEKKDGPLLDNLHHSEVGVHAGAFLPYGIFGVRSSYTAGGLRVNHHLGSYKTEVGLMYFNMESVSWTNVSYSLRSYLDYEFMKFFVYLGLDLHYYKPKPTNVRELPDELTGGGHVGFSPLFELGDNLYFRADFKMNAYPGSSLYAAFGFMYAFPEEAEKAQAPSGTP